MAPPDIIFGPEDEDFHPLHMTGRVGEGDLKFWNILSDWNYKDPTRLLALIQELRLGLMFTDTCYCNGNQNLLWLWGER